MKSKPKPAKPKAAKAKKPKYKIEPGPHAALHALQRQRKAKQIESIASMVAKRLASSARPVASGVSGVSGVSQSMPPIDPNSTAAQVVRDLLANYGPGALTDPALRASVKAALGVSELQEKREEIQDKRSGPARRRGRSEPIVETVTRQVKESDPVSTALDCVKALNRAERDRDLASRWSIGAEVKNELQSIRRSNRGRG